MSVVVATESKSHGRRRWLKAEGATFSVTEIDIG
jgi:hypothetical protein